MGLGAFAWLHVTAAIAWIGGSFFSCISTPAWRNSQRTIPR